ncbi:hypothetical protein NHX12_009411 [Muraenolepis orangiensis]|uniref:C1q domain-containing protein n=1 Tax=Muraenolepis orangiensis TaxID=630683 RepID=A0A9Q0DPR5_9TELE|nr:hypothetical protein NHX12_009411 [Muraenolepis orangiensis]
MPSAVVLLLAGLCAWLGVCRGQSASSGSGINDMLLHAIHFQGELPCGTWDCSCATRQTDCCCAANQLAALEDSTFSWMVDLWEKVEHLETERKALTESRQVAFSAAMTAQSGCFGPFTTNVPIPYTLFTLNDGEGYNPALGVFTALWPGVYSFSYTAHSHLQNPEGRLYHKIQLMKNGLVVASTWEDNREDTWDSGSQVVLLHLRRGCQVYMQMLSGRSICGNTLENNRFSGYLLYPDYE